MPKPETGRGSEEKGGPGMKREKRQDPGLQERRDGLVYILNEHVSCFVEKWIGKGHEQKSEH